MNRNLHQRGVIPWRSSEDATVIPITIPCVSVREKERKREREKERETEREGGRKRDRGGERRREREINMTQQSILLYDIVL